MLSIRIFEKLYSKYEKEAFEESELLLDIEENIKKIVKETENNGTNNCPNCNFEINTDWKFCKNCGNEL